VEGVIPSEMPSGFPLEALKAQAVAARGKVLGAWGVIHQTDPYDVCARVHCQVYSGLSKCDPRTTRAARETAGIVMYSDGKMVDAIFCGVCGGHTEDVDLAWGGKAYDYLKGTFDGPNSMKKYGPLHIEENARRWIDDNPEVFCNANQHTVPAALDYTKKYFRWEVRLTPDEIRNALSKRKIEIGDVLDLIPLERGVSGRIIRLKVVGSEGERIIRGELNIRQALSTTTLWSSCFYVRQEDCQFILKGAGWGHGVGMCQTGAAIMALGGKKFHEILKHYYRSVELKRLY
ncbi:MAG: SpoIID/LytB domain-containing protein, partial [Deltaproteobacteria bacterium]|nr:SpoIID/LytB domain-containing protein [Deltaproteobacteria bacterium]